ncbi:hypothetical protein TNCV_3831441 [Trichonephila clavipes]|nr:hypothetical protein TNCV_3831441 [Trichonephila clavipes]
MDTGGVEHVSVKQTQVRNMAAVSYLLVFRVTTSRTRRAYHDFVSSLSRLCLSSQWANSSIRRAPPPTMRPRSWTPYPVGPSFKSSLTLTHWNNIVHEA